MSDSNEDVQRRPTIFEEWRQNQGNQESAARAVIALSQPPVRLREIAILVLMTVLSDITLYRSQGYAGPAAWFLAAPVLLYFGMPRLKPDFSVWLVVPLMSIVCARLLWCGSNFAVAVGFVVLCCFAMTLVGLRPYMTRVVVFASSLIAAGHRGLKFYFGSLSRLSLLVQRAPWFAVTLPLAALVTFAMIFVMANPDLSKAFGDNVAQLVESLQEWIRQFQIAELLFCFCAGWLITGTLRPDVHQTSAAETPVSIEPESVRSPLYDGYRNTLAVVIVLFAVYLIFEFQTLWFKTFPQGFYYSGYAHEGAAWLTVALGLSTIMLSLIFRRSILADPRRARLRAMSWIWSIENLLLAAAVFNRLFIYIGFNGMTRMRVVGMLGVASVVVGFLLVLRKIAQNYSFVWLIRRQLWTVSFAAYLYAVLPVDAFVNQYNVNCILQGNYAPSVQISVHPTSDEGFLLLKPLMNCSNAIIRDGVRGILDKKLNEMVVESLKQESAGWTVKQIAHDRLLDQLRALPTAWQNDPDHRKRDQSIAEFHQYAYQWY